MIAVHAKRICVHSDKTSIDGCDVALLGNCQRLFYCIVDDGYHRTVSVARYQPSIGSVTAIGKAFAGCSHGQLACHSQGSAVFRADKNGIRNYLLAGAQRRSGDLRVYRSLVIECTMQFDVRNSCSQ
jgi:hypothetical protein